MWEVRGLDVKQNGRRTSSVFVHYEERVVWRISEFVHGQVYIAKRQISWFKSRSPRLELRAAGGASSELRNADEFSHPSIHPSSSRFAPSRLAYVLETGQRMLLLNTFWSTRPYIKFHWNKAAVVSVCKSSPYHCLYDFLKFERNPQNQAPWHHQWFKPARSVHGSSRTRVWMWRREVEDMTYAGPWDPWNVGWTGWRCLPSINIIGLRLPPLPPASTLVKLYWLGFRRLCDETADSFDGLWRQLILFGILSVTSLCVLNVVDRSPSWLTKKRIHNRNHTAFQKWGVASRRKINIRKG